jgi:hypothetical protein
VPSDNTISIIKRYENLFEGRLKYISEEDSGIYDAWNKGVEKLKVVGYHLLVVMIYCANTFSDFIEFAKQMKM